MRAGIRFENEHQIDRNLGKLTKAVSNRVKGRALMAGGRVLAAEAKLLAPELSGELKSSIIAARRTSDPDATRGDGAIRVYVGPRRGKGFHGLFVELGTNDTAAQPFIAPAFDGPAAGEALSVIAQVLNEEIKKATS